MTSTTPAATSPDPGRRLHLLGVRHHGPGSARSVRRALEQIRPERLLVEAPADAQPALAWIGRRADDALTPPVALLGYAVARPELAVFAPLAVFSPEWQALAWAAEHGVAAEAIDLPLAMTLAEAAAAAAAPSDGVASEADPLGALAAAAGEPDAERWWDDVVEHRGDGPAVFDAIAAAMAVVRAGTPTAPSEARREAHMRGRVRRALAQVEGPVVVVCGAWHVPALDPSTTSAGADAAALRGRPKLKVAFTWVPWTHRRLRRATGYGAGVDSPGWYAHMYDHPGPEGIARFFVDAAHALRRNGMAASPDHLIGATRLASSLAALRLRPGPGLAEVLDAADAVMGGLPLVVDQLVVGDAIGRVPDDAPQVPLARDVAAAQRAARLTPESTSRRIELDVRTPNGRRRSHLLHRLVAVEVPWGTLEEGRGSSGTFRETWRLQWEPELSIRIVERAALGTTLVAAASVRLVERAGGAARVPDAAAVVQTALLADLGAAMGPAVQALGRLAAASPDVAELMDTLGSLADAIRYGDVRGTDAAGLRSVFDELVVRIVAGLQRAATGSDAAAARAMAERLSSLQAALATLDHPARRDALPRELERLAGARRVHGLVQGRATRLLHDGGRWSAGEVEARLGRALTSGTPAADGAAFVEGFLAGSGTVLLHDDQLLAAVDAWVSSLPVDAFGDVVALLRRTFGAFEPAERRQLGVVLTGRQGERTTVAGDDLDAERVALAMTTVRAMLGLPERDAGPAPGAGR